MGVVTPPHPPSTRLRLDLTHQKISRYARTCGNVSAMTEKNEATMDGFTITKLADGLYCVNELPEVQRHVVVRGLVQDCGMAFAEAASVMRRADKHGTVSAVRTESGWNIILGEGEIDSVDHSTPRSLVDLFPILRYFAWEHLPAHLQQVSRPFYTVALGVAERYAEGADERETAKALDRLLEAKDAAVRAVV